MKIGQRSPAIVIALLALVAALAGTAVAGPDTKTGVSKNKVKKIAAKQVNKLAPGLSVAHADEADAATTATKADALEGFEVVARGTVAGPGTVAVNDCQGSSLAVPGLRSDDHVILTPPEGWQTHEVTLMPFVQAPGILSYTMCNHSGGSGTTFNQALAFMVLR